MAETLRASFIKAATWHGSLESADAMLRENPWLAQNDIHIAAILGDHASVRKFLALDAANATALSEPFDGSALVYLCLSKYLRLGRAPAADFIQAATALLDAGADPNGGFWTKGKFPEFETPLYGAAGVAHHAGLTRLLLERGADPNDGEAVYHSPETWENSALKELVETGKLTSQSLCLMLIRKHDWHDYEGAKYLLEHGANPNTSWGRGNYPIHHALQRDNGLDMIRLLLDHGADPTLTGPEPAHGHTDPAGDGLTAIARAARQGRSDVLELLEQRGFSIALEGVDKLIAACAMGDKALAEKIATEDPSLKKELLSMGGTLLARFTGTGNLQGVNILLDLGIDVNTPFTEGDGYFEIPAGSLPIHIATWRARHAVVKFLLEKGASPDLPDANGRTPLMLAVKASINSYWMIRRSPESVAALLAAGASAAGIPLPTGYAEIDALLEK